jgi:glutathione S-transferase
MTQPTLYGATYSVYVRAAQLALAEKGVAYTLIEVDVFGGAVPDWYAKQHPFMRVPAFQHDGFQLYETTAIMHYVDEAFAGPPLMPPATSDGARARARVVQIGGVIDAYLYRPLIWDICVQRCDPSTGGRAPDEPKIAAAIPRVNTCFAAIEDLMVPDAPFLLGAQLTLADLHLAPMVSLGVRAAEGAALLAAHTKLHAWWATMRDRPSLMATLSEASASP